MICLLLFLFPERISDDIVESWQSLEIVSIKFQTLVMPRNDCGSNFSYIHLTWEIKGQLKKRISDEYKIEKKY